MNFYDWQREAIEQGLRWASHDATARAIYASLSTPAPSVKAESDLARLRQDVAELRAEIARLKSLRKKDVAAINGNLEPLFREKGGILESVLARLEALEARPMLEFRGAWSEDQTYPAGSVVMSSGSAWHAQIESKGIQPGRDASAAWKLMVRRGRDGRSAKDSP
jgi:hypothetical protein